MVERILKIGSHTITLQLGDTCSISSDLKEVCPHCQDSECYFTCEKSQVIPDCQFPELAKEEEVEKVQSRRVWNSAMDAIESTILAHASIDPFMVHNRFYTICIETAIEAMSNKLH